VSQQGEASQSTTNLAALEQIFPVDGTSGISSALDSFFSAFSALTTTPNDTTLRQSALDQAQNVASAFNQASNSLSNLQQSTQQDLASQVTQVNQIAQQIASINQQVADNSSAATDPGLSAQMSTALEQLSSYANVSVLKQEDGTVSVNIGQSLLVSGTQALPLQWVPGQGQETLEDAQGNPVASTIQSGSLTASIDMLGSTIPSAVASIDQMAQTFADAVNNALNNGVDETGAVPAQNLFSYDAAAGAAGTLAVNSLQPSDLALADASAPGGDAIAAQIAGLQSTNLIGNQTLSQYYGSQAAQIGQLSSNAQADESTANALVSQAQSARSDIQGVSLDDEAMYLLQYQRAYSATSQLVQSIDQLTEDLMTMMSMTT
jgi:flagellar hook-associated protein 1 FlgK